jgi:hypothetical protein
MSFFSWTKKSNGLALVEFRDCLLCNFSAFLKSKTSWYNFLNKLKMLFQHLPSAKCNIPFPLWFKNPFSSAVAVLAFWMVQDVPLRSAHSNLSLDRSELKMCISTRSARYGQPFLFQMQARKANGGYGKACSQCIHNNPYYFRNHSNKSFVKWDSS